MIYNSFLFLPPTHPHHPSHHKPKTSNLNPRHNQPSVSTYSTTHNTTNHGTTEIYQATHQPTVAEKHHQDKNNRDPLRQNNQNPLTTKTHKIRPIKPTKPTKSDPQKHCVPSPTKSDARTTEPQPMNQGMGEREER